MIKRREMILALFVFIFGFILLRIATEPRRAAKRTLLCYSNLHQIGVALAQYAQDHDDTLPRAWYGRNNGPSDAKSNYKWMDAIFPYLKNEALFTCPEDHFDKPYHFRSGTNYGSYVMNNAYYLPGDNLTPPAGLRFSQIKDFDSTVLVTDGFNDFQCAWPDIQNTPPPFSNDLPRLGAISGRHGNSFRPLALGCDGACSSALREFQLRRTQHNGKFYYPPLTVEDD